MNGELRRLLQPQVLKVQSAQADLDTSNKSDASPLESLAPAGRVIREQQALIDALTDLLDRRDPNQAECGCEETMRLQGRLRSLAEMQHQH